MRRALYKFICLTFIFFVPPSVFAALSINEIMYNPEGADADREWIEIYNSGSQSVDLSQYFFYENETFHKIAKGNIAAGSYVLLAKKPEILSQEISGVEILKSSFSLSNKGETLSLANKEKEIFDTVSYSPTDGANGDGESLQKTGGPWVHAEPTPGRKNKESSSFLAGNSQGSTSSGESSSGGSGDASPQETQRKKTFEPYYRIIVDRSKEEVFVDTHLSFDIQAQLVKQGEEKDLSSGYYYVNFGDGTSTSFSGDTLTCSHRYRKEGNYQMVVLYYSSLFLYKEGKEADASLHQKIVVHKPSLGIKALSYREGLVIENNSDFKIDISNYRIVTAKKSYSFPEQSYLYPHSEITLFIDMLGFDPLADKTELYLQTDLGLAIDSYSPFLKKSGASPKLAGTPKRERSETTSDREVDSLVLEESTNSLDEFSFSSKEDFFEENTAFLDSYLEQHPEKRLVDFGDTPPLEQLGSRGESSLVSQNSFIYSILFLLFTLVILRIWLVRNDKNKKTEDSEDSILGDIELIE